MNTSQKIDVYGLSYRGLEQDNNQNHFAIATLNKSMRLHQSNLTIEDDSRVHGQSQGHLFLVADRVDSSEAPTSSNGTAVDSVVQYFLNEMPWFHLADGEPSEVTLALEDALRNAQGELLKNESEAEAGPATTMTLAFVFWPNLYIAHVGDNCCYLNRNNQLLKLTGERSVEELQELASEREQGGTETMFLNAVRSRPGDLPTEVRHLTLEPGDVLTLMSDGVTTRVPEDELQALLNIDATAEQVCGRLLSGSATEDRTAVVVRFLPLEGSKATTITEPSHSPLTAMRKHEGPDKILKLVRQPYQTAGILRETPSEPRRTDARLADSEADFPAWDAERRKAAQ